jgi:type II secretion system protein N
LNAIARRLRRYALYGSGFLFVFLVFAWANLPTKALAWRISHEARNQGIMLTVDDLSVSPFGSVTLEHIQWSFKPGHPDQVPVPFVMEELDVDVSLLSLLIGNLDVDIEGTMDEGTLTGNFTRGGDEGKVSLVIEDLPLYSVPKLQQAVNAPVRGLFGLQIDLTLPENKFEKAHGVMQLTCAGCSVGDGETKLYVPGARGMLTEGVTVPEINLGSIVGQLNVEGGEASMEEFEAQGDDITLRMGGKIKLDDPFQKSRLDLVLKLFVSERLMEANDQVRLMIATSSKTAQMVAPDEGWLGFKLEGTVGRPKFSGIKAKSREDRVREARAKQAERSEERRRKKAERDAAKKAKEEEREAAAAEAEEAGAFVPDPNQQEAAPAGDEPAGDDTTAPAQPAVGTAVTFENQPSAPAGGGEGDDGEAEDGAPAGEEPAPSGEGGEPEPGGEAGEGGAEGGAEGGSEAGEAPIIQ